MWVGRYSLKVWHVQKDLFFTGSNTGVATTTRWFTVTFSSPWLEVTELLKGSLIHSIKVTSRIARKCFFSPWYHPIPIGIKNVIPSTLFSGKTQMFSGFFCKSPHKTRPNNTHGKTPGHATPYSCHERQGHDWIQTQECNPVNSRAPWWVGKKETGIHSHIGSIKLVYSSTFTIEINHSFM